MKIYTITYPDKPSVTGMRCKRCGFDSNANEHTNNEKYQQYLVKRNAEIKAEQDRRANAARAKEQESAKSPKTETPSIPAKSNEDKNKKPAV